MEEKGEEKTKWKCPLHSTGRTTLKCLCLILPIHTLAGEKESNKVTGLVCLCICSFSFSLSLCIPLCYFFLFWPSTKLGSMLIYDELSR